MSKGFAHVTALVCFSWMWLWILWGCSVSGSKWFLRVATAATFSEDQTKSVLPILVMTLPILIAGTVASIGQRLKHPLKEDQTGPKTFRVPALPHQCPRWIHQCFQVFYKGGLCLGDVDRKNTFFFLILLPICIYVASFIHRKLIDHAEDDMNEKVMQVANGFGFGALIALNLLMIPVARYSPLLRLVGWSQSQAMCFHRWIGRLVVFAVVIHGAVHTFRWMFVLNENVWKLSTIPSVCWSDWDGYQLACTTETDCTCYLHFRNLTGYLAALALIIILISSIGLVRRKAYHIFLRIHIVAAPLTLLMTIAHYPKAILYLAGGLLYYLASSMPVFVENRTVCCETSGVALVLAELIESDIPDDDTMMERSCVSLTVQASPIAMQRYRPGQYIRLWAPEISAEAHPFTINQVVSSSGDTCARSNQLRIIFRQTGRFTKKLGNRLLDSNLVPPTIRMDGFHGTYERMEQLLQHDAVLVIAGGIGITPYLSMLHYLCTYSKTSHSTVAESRKLVRLHWICRDKALIGYVQREYLEQLVSASEWEYEIQCVIHYTGRPTRDVERNESSSLSVRSNGSSQEFENPDTAMMFVPSKFAPGSKATYRGNFPMFTSFVLVGGFGLAMVWICCRNWTTGYLWAAIPLVAFCILVAVLVNSIMPDNRDLLTALNCRDTSMNPSYHGLCELPPVVADETDSANTESDPSLSITPLGTQINNDEHHGKGRPQHKPTASDLSENIDKVPAHQVVEGRPYIANLMMEARLDDALLPAIYACGPDAMMRHVREAINDRRWLRSGRCRGRIALYEETFEM